jgi:hypothetical protein
MDYNKLYILSAKILIGLQLIPIIVGLLRYSILNKPLRIFLTYSIVFFILDFLVQILIYLVYNNYDYFSPMVSYWQLKDFSFTSIFFYIIDFIFIGWFFYLVFKPLIFANYVKWISIILLVAVILNFLFFGGYKSLGVFNPTIVAIYNFAIPCIFMWYLFIQDSKIAISKNPYFWINLKLIIPNLITLILHFIGDKIEKTDSILFSQISLAKNGIWLLGLIFVTIGFYYARYTKYMPKATA